ncbi:MAG TPA: aspartate carbamoyltransferase catalytic subunit [Actinomycetota bacterium]|nr:aspartate carbamoyltransferase catalytic subunit [Actinomycetota bacterium]
MSAPDRHLLSIRDLEPSEVQELLDTAESMRSVSEREVKKLPTLRGRTIVNLFYEASTRTRVSFELAAKRLSADVVNVASSASSIEKGESLRDTGRTLAAMGVDAIVLRHPSAGAAARLAQCVDCSVINAGDGAHEHPTQALLDLLTIRRHFGRIEGLRVAIAGDISHSRVARSTALGLSRMGARVVLVAPPSMLPRGVEQLGCATSSNLDEELGSLDVLYLLRIQKERHRESLVPSEAEFAALYGLTPARLERLPAACAVMHPGPMNRGLEIAWEAAESGRSLVEQQVAAGVCVRMAVLYRLLGAPAMVEAAS